MQILFADQIRQWDAYTIKHQHISSLDLMERAVTKCVTWLESHEFLHRHFFIFCGKGNNGGDGLALARLLKERHCTVDIFMTSSESACSADFETNLERLRKTNSHVAPLAAIADFPLLPTDALVIDALFGSGLNRPVDDITASLVNYLNEAKRTCIAVDIPSGMFADQSSKGHPVINATYTLTFQCLKLAFLMPESEKHLGQIKVLDIGLAPEFLETIDTRYVLMEKEMIAALYQPRRAFTNKGSFGHALLVAGGYGKMGAAVLSVKGALQSGVGLLTCYIPACGYTIMQITNPEAMVLTDDDEKNITSLRMDLSAYAAVGIGPGMGTNAKTVDALEHLLDTFHKPLVIDADALNMIAKKPELLKKIPPDSILTPHPKEFDRLFGECANDFKRMELAQQKATALGVIIVLKGHRTFIAMPTGKHFFNSTGNAGMATGGSGDTLTGILTGLIAQPYSPAHAVCLGVYLHGRAGDLAAAEKSQEAMTAGDISGFLGDAFKSL